MAGRLREHLGGIDDAGVAEAEDGEPRDTSSLFGHHLSDSEKAWGCVVLFLTVGLLTLITWVIGWRWYLMYGRGTWAATGVVVWVSWYFICSAQARKRQRRRAEPPGLHPSAE